MGVVFTPRAGTHPLRIPPLPVPRVLLLPLATNLLQSKTKETARKEQDHDTIIPHRDQC